MIELVSEALCTKCNLCVAVCPTNVFDKVSGGIPQISRQSDCQTCFMCELYCPVDALYVSPEADRKVVLDERQLQEQDLLGSYRAAIGWNPKRLEKSQVDESYKMYEAMSRSEGMPPSRTSAQR